MSILIERLSHTFAQGTPFEYTALREITLKLDAGSRIGIAGRSGSGKSTLIQHLNGLLMPTGGTVSVNGLEVSPRNLKELRRRVGMVFQQPERQLFEETVFREIAFGLTGSGITAAETERRVNEALHSVGLGEEILDRSPFALSCGEKRRVAIAGVLVTEPEVLVMDEPTAGLDPRGRREILDLISGLQKERGLTLVMVSHNMEDLARLCNRVVVLDNGAVALDGKTRDVFRDSGALEMAGLRAPRISYLMMKLKMVMPELDDTVLTVEEARIELGRVWRLKQMETGSHDERDDHGEVFPRRFDYSPIGSENEIDPDGDLYDRCLSC
jgi:energy-coupling factor transport system ATP-binding protein